MERTILLIISFLTEAVVLWQYASSLFAPAHPKPFRLALLSALYVALFFLSLPGNSWMNITGYFIANVFFLYIQYRLNILFALFHSAILTAIMGFSELAVFGITSHLAPHFFSDADMGLALYGLFSKLMFFAAIYLLVHFISIKTDNHAHYDHSIFLLMTIPVSSIFIMTTFFTIGEQSPYAPPQSIMVTTSAVLLLVMNLLVFGINQYSQKKSMEFTDMQLLLQKESDSALYYEMLLTQSENQSILIHDIKKHLQSIELLNQGHETENVSAYICQLMDSSDLTESVRLCDNEMLNAILGRCQRQCREKHITFHADIRSGVLNHLQQNDLTSLFCNLLDNAVEAAEQVPDSFLEISVQKKENTPFVVIIIVNSCLGNPISGPDALPVSHKSDRRRHGFGIRSIQKVAKKYQGDLQMYYDAGTSTFHTIVTLKHPPQF